MWLQTSAGTHVQITATHAYAKTAHVYNLTISDLHTYYVGVGGAYVLVHNEIPCETLGARIGQELSGNFPGKRQAIADAINALKLSQKDAAKTLLAAAGRAWEKQGGQVTLADGVIAQLPALTGPNVPILIVEDNGLIRPAIPSVEFDIKLLQLVVTNVR